MDASNAADCNDVHFGDDIHDLCCCDSAHHYTPNSYYDVHFLVHDENDDAAMIHTDDVVDGHMMIEKTTGQDATKVKNIPKNNNHAANEDVNSDDQYYGDDYFLPHTCILLFLLKRIAGDMMDVASMLMKQQQLRMDVGADVVLHYNQTFVQIEL